jgi:Zonular occludens toxin (Zot)
MAILCYSGLPGTGKTASATLSAVKHFNQQNSFINKLIHLYKESYLTTYKQFFKKQLYIVIKELTINNVYSNYPILLDTKKQIYSNSIKPSDLEMKYQLPSGSLIILDEVQRYYDSREFKTFPKQLGVFFQHHRHGSIKDIILVTQHPRRLDNKMRDLVEIFRKYRLFIKIPLIPVIFCTYSNYYEFEDYGSYHLMKREMRSFDVDNHIQLIWSFNSFTRYNSKYFNVIFNALKTLPIKMFKSKDLTLDELYDIGIQHDTSK